MVVQHINEGAREPLKQILEKLGSNKRLAIIGGQASYPEQLFAEAKSDVRLADELVLRGFSVNPKFEEIRDASHQLRAFSPDLVIGVGGGTILDIAKVISRLATIDINDNELENLLKGGERDLLAGQKVDLVLMPTTAGSGAEATTFAVVYFGYEKYSFSNSSLRPSYVIADVSLIENAPRAILASSVMDAVAQAIESSWAKGGQQKSRQYAAEGLKQIWRSATNAVIHRDRKSLADIVSGSNLVGQAINISKTTGNHALSYFLTKKYNIPHGHCVGMLLPQFFKLHQQIAKSDSVRGEKIATSHHAIASLVGFDTFDEFVDSYDDLLSSLKLESFVELKAKNDFNAKAAVSSVNLQRLGNHPIPLTENELISIFS